MLNPSIRCVTPMTNQIRANCFPCSPDCPPRNDVCSPTCWPHCNPDCYPERDETCTPTCWPYCNPDCKPEDFSI